MPYKAGCYCRGKILHLAYEETDIVAAIPVVGFCTVCPTALYAKVGAIYPYIGTGGTLRGLWRV